MESEDRSLKSELEDIPLKEENNSSQKDTITINPFSTQPIKIKSGGKLASLLGFKEQTAVDTTFVELVKTGTLEQCQEFVEDAKKKSVPLDVIFKNSETINSSKDEKDEDSLSLQTGNSLIRDEQGYTVLHHAVLRKHVRITLWLIDEVKIDINDCHNLKGQTPLHWAVLAKSIEMIEILSRKGAENKNDKEGQSVEHYASFHGFVLGLHFFYLQGGKINSLDFMGRTPLHLAALNNHTTCVIYLLNRNCNPNSLDSNRSTPLHYSALGGSFNPCNLLIDFGADYKLTNNDGHTAQELAMQNNNFDVGHALNDHARVPQLGKPTPLTGSKKVALELSPLFVPPFLYYAFTTFPLFLFILISIGFGYLLNLTLPWLYPGRGVNSKIPFLHIISALFWFGIYLLSCYKYTPELWILHILFPFFYGVMWYIYYKTVTMDPGRLKDRPDSLKVTSENMVDLIQEYGLNQKSFCVVCEIHKPLRARHCRICNTCIARMDHHCPWTNACIGTLNHSWFMLLLLLWCIVAACSWLAAYQYMINDIEGLPPFRFGYGTFLYFQKIYLTDPSPIFILITNSFHFGWVILLLFQQIGLMLLNFTMVETQLENENHYQRDGNPWSLGSPLKNVKQFFGVPGFRVNWMKVYQEEDYNNTYRHWV